MSQMKPLGRLEIGTRVEAPREAGDDEFEPCKIKAMDAQGGTLDLTFEDGFVRKGCPFGETKFSDDSLAATGSGFEGSGFVEMEHLRGQSLNIEPIDPGQMSKPDIEELDATEAAYATEVGPRLPAIPSATTLEDDAEAKYAYVKAYKDLGNALFKEGKFEWAIQTYVGAVDALVANCYASRERMVWDYFASVPCGQCYSNAALCALKLGDAAQASRLCDLAMTCKPEDTDLVKVLLRNGQAKLALHEPEVAKELLERAAGLEPNNRSVREELAKAKKAVKELAKQADARLFKNVNLEKTGITSKKQTVLEERQARLDAGFEHLANGGKDVEALRQFTPLLESANAEDKAIKPTTMLAAYGVGVAKYHQRNQDEALTALTYFYKLKAELDADGVEYKEPCMGYPLPRFYYAHCLFEKQRLPEAVEHATKYLEEVAAAGPQRILNMPSGMAYELLGRHVTDLERAASRHKNRASSGEAQCDAHTMLAMAAERTHGYQAAIPHFESCVRLGNDEQQVDAHENLATTYEALSQGDGEGMLEKRDEHKKLAEEVRAKIARDKAAKEAKEVEKKQIEDNPQDVPADVKAMAGMGPPIVPQEPVAAQEGPRMPNERVANKADENDDREADAFPTAPEHDGDAAIADVSDMPEAD